MADKVTPATVPAVRSIVIVEKEGERCDLLVPKEGPTHFDGLRHGADIVTDKGLVTIDAMGTVEGNDHFAADGTVRLTQPQRPADIYLKPSADGSKFDGFALYTNHPKMVFDFRCRRNKMPPVYAKLLQDAAKRQGVTDVNKLKMPETEAGMKVWDRNVALAANLREALKAGDRDYVALTLGARDLSDEQIQEALALLELPPVDETSGAGLPTEKAPQSVHIITSSENKPAAPAEPAAGKTPIPSAPEPKKTPAVKPAEVITLAGGAEAKVTALQSNEILLSINYRNILSNLRDNLEARKAGGPSSLSKTKVQPTVVVDIDGYKTPWTVLNMAPQDTSAELPKALSKIAAYLKKHAGGVDVPASAFRLVAITQNATGPVREALRQAMTQANQNEGIAVSAIHEYRPVFRVSDLLSKGKREEQLQGSIIVAIIPEATVLDGSSSDTAGRLLMHYGTFLSALPEPLGVQPANEHSF